MPDFAQRYREDRRAWLLQILAQQPAYRANTSNLHAALYALGVAASRDDVVTDLHWLHDQALVALERITESVEVATLTARGQDVVRGLAKVPGVSPPQPV